MSSTSGPIRPDLCSLGAPMIVGAEQEQELQPGGTSGLPKAASPAPGAHWTSTSGTELGTRCSLLPQGHLCSKDSPPQTPHPAVIWTVVPPWHLQNSQLSTGVCGVEERGTETENNQEISPEYLKTLCVLGSPCSKTFQYNSQIPAPRWLLPVALTR